jgi:hypothetical protein
MLNTLDSQGTLVALDRAGVGVDDAAGDGQAQFVAGAAEARGVGRPKPVASG